MGQGERGNLDFVFQKTPGKQPTYQKPFVTLIALEAFMAIGVVGEEQF
jgi:hypothetical protein